MTPKQRRFVREVVSGKSQSDAYRAAYRAEDMKPNTVHREAHRLMKNPKVATSIGELITQADQQVVTYRIATREEVLAAISALMVAGEPRDSVRLKAAETMGKHYGLFRERLAIEEPDRSAQEIEEELTQKLTELGLWFSENCDEE